MKRLIDILELDTVKIPVISSSRDDVIKELIELFAIKGLFEDKHIIYKAVIERERIMTTGVGNGIAIPHCKHDSCKDFALAVGVADEDIDFQAVDQNPVRLVFLLIGPTNAAGMHIKILSRITRIMSKVETRERIEKIKDPRELYQLLITEEEKTFS